MHDPKIYGKPEIGALDPMRCDESQKRFQVKRSDIGHPSEHNISIMVWCIASIDAIVIDTCNTVSVQRACVWCSLAHWLPWLFSNLLPKTRKQWQSTTSSSFDTTLTSAHGDYIKATTDTHIVRRHTFLWNLETVALVFPSLARCRCFIFIWPF